MMDEKGGDAQGLARDERGQDQPADSSRAQQAPGKSQNKSPEPPYPESPGQPAGGE
jgi:hypothetical protein